MIAWEESATVAVWINWKSYGRALLPDDYGWLGRPSCAGYTGSAGVVDSRIFLGWLSVCVASISRQTQKIPD